MKIAATNVSPVKLPAKQPVYAVQAVELTAGDKLIPVRLWHKVERVIPAKTAVERDDVVPGLADLRDYRETVATTCGERFEPEALLYGERTLIDWGDDDDICECAAALPTEAECKTKGAQLILEKPVKNELD